MSSTKKGGSLRGGPPNISQITKEADRLLEKNNFAAAKDMFRAACLLAPPTQHILQNLGVAEEQERLEFSRSLGEKYPSSLLAQLAEVTVLMSMGGHWNTHASGCCAKILQNGNLEAIDAIHIRRLRFQAAVCSRPYDAPNPYETLIEDFREVWNAVGTFPLAVRLRQGLLEDLATMQDYRTVHVLEALSEEDWLPTIVKQFLEQKVGELRILREAIEEYKQL